LYNAYFCASEYFFYFPDAGFIFLMLASGNIPSAKHYLLFPIQVENDLDQALSINAAEVIHAVMNMEFWLLKICKTVAV
jgi:hypothetical protein